MGTISKKPPTLILNSQSTLHHIAQNELSALKASSKLGVSAQVSGSNIKATVSYKTQDQLHHLDFKISNDDEKGVHLLFDLFATVSKIAIKVPEIVANISWAGSHMGDLEDSKAKDQGFWRHSNFAIEGHQDENGKRLPLNIGKFFKERLNAINPNIGLSVRNGLSEDYTKLKSDQNRNFKLRLLHDPHASLENGKKGFDLKEGDNLIVLLGGTGSNAWIAEGYNPQSGEFQNHIQTRFGQKVNLLKDNNDWDNYGKYLEPYKRWHLNNDSAKKGKKNIPQEEIDRLLEKYFKAEKTFAGGNENDPDAGVKATFNHIRYLLIINHNYRDTPFFSHAKSRLDKIAELIGYDDMENLQENFKSHPVLSKSIKSSNDFIKRVDANADDPFVKAIMTNLVSRFANTFAETIKDNYGSSLEKLKGFTIHGNFIHALFKTHDLKDLFRKTFNQVAGTKLEDTDLHLDSGKYDGAFDLTLKELTA